MSGVREHARVAQSIAADILAEEQKTITVVMQHLLIRAWYAGYGAGFDHAAAIATNKDPK